MMGPILGFMYKHLPPQVSVIFISFSSVAFIYCLLPLFCMPIVIANMPPIYHKDLTMSTRLYTR